MEEGRRRPVGGQRDKDGGSEGGMKQVAANKPDFPQAKTSATGAEPPTR